MKQEIIKYAQGMNVQPDREGSTAVANSAHYRLNRAVVANSSYSTAVVNSSYSMAVVNSSYSTAVAKKREREYD